MRLPHREALPCHEKRFAVRSAPPAEFGIRLRGVLKGFVVGQSSCSGSLTVENDRGHESDVVEEFETYVTKDRVMIMNVQNF